MSQQYPLLKYITLEDMEGNSLRMRQSDNSLMGFCIIGGDREEMWPEEREMWKRLSQIFGTCEMTPEFQERMSKQFNGELASTTFDLTNGEVLIKEIKRYEQTGQDKVLSGSAIPESTGHQRRSKGNSGKVRGSEDKARNKANPSPKRIRRSSRA